MRAQGRPRRGFRAAAAAALAALALVLAPAALDGARAAFSATTTNTGDQLATRRLQPPSGLTVAQSCTPSPAITHRTATSATGTTSVAPPLPLGTTAGDLLLAQIVYRSGEQTITAPAGWTLQMSTSNGTQITSAVYWKVAAADEASPVFSRPTWATGVMAGGLNAFVGVRGSLPVVTSGSLVNTGTTATTPALSTTATTVEVVHLLSKVQEALPTPAGTTLLMAGTAGFWPDSLGVVAGDETFVGPGAIVSRSSTSTSSTWSEWIAQTLVLQRARNIPSVNLSWTGSPSSWAGGYELTRAVGGSVQATQAVPGVGTTSVTNGPLTNGTSYSFRLSTSQGTWRSTAVTAGLTPSC